MRKSRRKNLMLFIIVRVSLFKCFFLSDFSAPSHVELINSLFICKIFDSLNFVKYRQTLELCLAELIKVILKICPLYLTQHLFFLSHAHSPNFLEAHSLLSGSCIGIWGRYPGLSLEGGTMWADWMIARDRTIFLGRVRDIWVFVRLGPHNDYLVIKFIIGS